MSGTHMMMVGNIIPLNPTTYLPPAAVQSEMAGTPISTYRADAILGTSGTAATSNFNVQSATPLGILPTPKIGG